MDGGDDVVSSVSCYAATAVVAFVDIRAPPGTSPCGFASLGGNASAYFQLFDVCGYCCVAHGQHSIGLGATRLEVIASMRPSLRFSRVVRK